LLEDSQNKLAGELQVDSYEYEIQPESSTDFLRNKTILRNLAIIIYMWITNAISYYMVNLLLKYLPGNIYTNSVSSYFAEMFGTFISGILYAKKGIKVSFTAMYISTMIGGLLTMTLGAANVSLMPFFVIFIRLGSSGAFNLVYIANKDVFPTLFSSSAMGYSNFFARLFATFGPQIAEMESPYPMLVLICMNLFAIIVIQKIIM